MIKINLLDSVTERSRGVAAVEARVANPRTRTLTLMCGVFLLTLLAMVFDYVSTNSAHAAATAEIERQERIAAQTALINKEQAELEKKAKEIETRIEVIKKLREAQQGPVGVLTAINERLPQIPDFTLEQIEQKEGHLTITGYSLNEAAVTRFGRALEFSDGLFTNVSIETEKKLVDAKDLDYDPAEGEAVLPGLVPEMVKFKIKCSYSKAGVAPAQPAANPAPAGNQIAQK